MGADAVIVNHEHVIHYGTILHGKVIAYSLGNFTSTTGVHSPPYDKMANYSLLLNLYLARSSDGVKPVDITFAITKSVSVGKDKVKTVLLFDLIKNCSNADERNDLLRDNLCIYNLFLGKKKTEIELKLEYHL